MTPSRHRSTNTRRVFVTISNARRSHAYPRCLQIVKHTSGYSMQSWDSSKIQRDSIPLLSFLSLDVVELLVLRVVLLQSNQHLDTKIRVLLYDPARHARQQSRTLRRYWCEKILYRSCILYRYQVTQVPFINETTLVHRRTYVACQVIRCLAIRARLEIAWKESLAVPEYL
ncbi:hypothetical protein TNCV_3162501 [Trichonephila clavipes]|nr:hypothetical protein TNCV_3162501 [Trichonephila clavipes]